MWSWGYGAVWGLGQNNVINVLISCANGRLQPTGPVSERVSPTYAIKTDNTLYAWGAGGLAATWKQQPKQIFFPVQIGALTNWSSSTWGSHGISHKN
jgi:hypothetical protein